MQHVAQFWLMDSNQWCKVVECILLIWSEELKSVKEFLTPIKTIILLSYKLNS